MADKTDLNERPVHVPEQIWEAASYFMDAWDNESCQDWRENVQRLMSGTFKVYSEELAPTWQKIVATIDTFNKRRLAADWEDRPDPQETYRLLLDLLAVFPDALDAEMRPALEEADRRLERIATLTRELMEEWDTFVDLRNAKGLQWGASEHELITTWVYRANCKIGPAKGFEEELSDFPRLGDLLDGLADAAEYHGIVPPWTHEYAEQGDGGVAGKGDVSALVRLFDARLVEYKRIGLPPELVITDMDLARLLSALLQRPVGRMAVLKARERTAQHAVTE